jgi:hypothetical protein
MGLNLTYAIARPYPAASLCRSSQSTAMPRYFFHVMDGQVGIDDEGTELPDADAARLEALKTAGSILAAGEANGMLAETPWNMTVVDESSRTVFTLAFQARKYF